MSERLRDTTLESPLLHVIFLDLWMTGDELLYWMASIRETFTTHNSPIGFRRLGTNTLILSTLKSRSEPIPRSFARRSLRSTSTQALQLLSYFRLPVWNVDRLRMISSQELRRLQLISQTSLPMSTSSLASLPHRFCILSMIWTLSPTRLRTIIGIVLQRANTSIDRLTETTMRWMLSSICLATSPNLVKS